MSEAMPEIRTVTTLRTKRDEIAVSVRLFERQLEQAKADLAHRPSGHPNFRGQRRPQGRHALHGRASPVQPPVSLGGLDT